MKRLLPSIIGFLLVISTSLAQKPLSAPPDDDRDPSGLLRDLISARGVDRWAPNDVLMGLTRPPMQPVKTLSEWEKARAVLLAVDSEISKSFSLNRKINTANSSESVNQRNQQVADLLNDAICEPSDTAEDTEDPDSASNVSEKSKEEYGCQDGELDLVTRERMFDHLEIAHDFISLVSSLSRYVDVMVLVRTSKNPGSGSGPRFVNTVVEETSNLTRSAQEFLEGLEADKEKERGLFSSAVYEFGTDLYRTYLNLLPIQVSTSFVVALPSYRDPGLQKEGNSAYERIQTAYRQLYAGVTLVPVSSDTFIKELGSVHCLSKILPDEIDFLTSDRNRAQLESHP